MTASLDRLRHRLSPERREQQRRETLRQRFGPPPGWQPGQHVEARPLLELRGLTKRFAHRAAIDGVDLKVRRGSAHALIGPNDAGKTTLLNLVSGEIRPDSGQVLLDGADVTGLAPHRLSRLGVGRAFQHTNLFWALPALDNVRLPAAVGDGTTRRAVGTLPSRFEPQARTLLARVGLGGLDSWLSASDLSAGDQHALELAVALAGRPRLLLLDEPTAGLGPRETCEAVALIRRLMREESLTLLIVEHDMDVVFDLADRITVMHQGRVLADGTPDEIARHPAVRHVYLGDLEVAERDARVP